MNKSVNRCTFSISTAEDLFSGVTHLQELLALNCMLLKLFSDDDVSRKMIKCLLCQRRKIQRVVCFFWKWMLACRSTKKMFRLSALIIVFPHLVAGFCPWFFVVMVFVFWSGFRSCFVSRTHIVLTHLRNLRLELC